MGGSPVVKQKVLRLAWCSRNVSHPDRKMHVYPTSIDPPPCVLFKVCAVIVSGDWGSAFLIVGW